MLPTVNSNRLEAQKMLSRKAEVENLIEYCFMGLTMVHLTVFKSQPS